MRLVKYSSATLFALAVLAYSSAPARAQDDPFPGVDIIRVEEDWVIDVADPDPAADCPQISTVFGPSDPAFGTHCLFELNHGTLPEFFEGGMQLQVWWGEQLVGYKQAHAPTELSVAIERITYTTVTRIDNNGDLDMYITNGHSVTWGNFGGTGYLWIELATSRTNLNSYNPDNSVENSKVGYGANRVNKFVRSEVRYYTAEGLYHTDTEDAVIHELAEAQVAPDPINE